MSSLISSSVIEDSTQHDGRRLVRYRYVVQDNLGGTHEILFDRGLVSAGFNADADRITRQQAILDQLALSEKVAFQSDLENGVNPFQTRPLRHHTRAEMLQTILRMFLSQKLPPSVIVLGAAFIDRVTDNEMKAVLGINDAKVAEIRIWTDKFKAHKADYDAYVPPLQEAQ